MSDRVTIVIPYFHNGATIVELLNGLMSSAGLGGSISEFIIVDDGSKESLKIREAMLSCGANGKIVELKSNSGQRQATLLGIKMATTEWICTIDADLQFSPYDLSRMFEMRNLHKGKMLGGTPLRTSYTAPRLFLSDIAWKILRFMVLGEFQTQFAFTSLRLIHRDFIDCYGAESIYQIWNAIPSAFATTAVGHFRRLHDESRYTLLSLFKFSKPYIVILLMRYFLLWLIVIVFMSIILPVTVSASIGLLSLPFLLFVIWPQKSPVIKTIITVS